MGSEPTERERRQQSKKLATMLCRREIYFPTMVIIFQRKNLNDALLRRHKLLTRKHTRKSNVQTIISMKVKEEILYETLHETRFQDIDIGPKTENTL
ncbi:CLUMA_CG009291, isoform A [Clunio marinus]|uniref:CLUMA_CG009291, isoform A n=1 Tax=Clunio marinus TaxID=568069 RepID=A0A1J1I7X8_9DIPT|nr:CLUMA_CG009291, isoform A [Clunio marinus]